MKLKEIDLLILFIAIILLYLEYRIISTSADGQIYTQSFTLEGRTVENCDDLIMVETIMVPGDVKQMNGSPSVSAHFSQLSNLFFSSWEDNVSLIGKLQVDREPEIICGYRLNPSENKEKAATFPLGRSGNIFSSFEDICASETAFYGAAVIKKNSNNLDMNLSNFGLGFVFKVTKESIQYQPIINVSNANAIRIETFVPFDYDQKGDKNYYLLCMMEDGSLQINHVNPSDEEVLPEIVKESTIAASSNILTEIDNLIKPQTLENAGLKNVLVSNELLDAKSKNYFVDYMEKSFVLDPNLLQFEEEMTKFTNQQTQSNLKYGVQPSNAAISVLLDKSLANFTVKLKSRDYVIFGARLRLEIPVQLKLKIFGREITLNNPATGEKSRFVDVILSEEEVAYVYLAEKFKFSILPTNKSNIISFERS